MKKKTIIFPGMLKCFEHYGTVSASVLQQI